MLPRQLPESTNSPVWALRIRSCCHYSSADVLWNKMLKEWSRQLKCSDKEIIKGTSHAPLPSPLEASSAAAINTCPAAVVGTVREDAHMLPAPKKIGNYRITQVLSGGAALKAPVQPAAPRQYLVSQLWLCPAKSSKYPKTNCMLCLFNTWGLILDTLMQLKEWQKNMQAYFLLGKAQD